MKSGKADEALFSTPAKRLCHRSEFQIDRGQASGHAIIERVLGLSPEPLLSKHVFSYE